MVAQVNTPTARQFRSSQNFETLAEQLYDKVKGQSLLAQVKKLFGKSERDRLLTLDELSQQVRIRGQKSAGVKKVALNKIVGTVAEGRSQDFDINFRPLQRHNKERWVSVAAAWISGRRLGHIRLVQVGDVFFVDDGHHRVSVARAMGEKVIEANIAVLLGTGKLSVPSQAKGMKKIGSVVSQPAAA